MLFQRVGDSEAFEALSISPDASAARLGSSYLHTVANADQHQYITWALWSVLFFSLGCHHSALEFLTPRALGVILREPDPVTRAVLVDRYPVMVKGAQVFPGLVRALEKARLYIARFYGVRSLNQQLMDLDIGILKRCAGEVKSQGKRPVWQQGRTTG